MVTRLQPLRIPGGWKVTYNDGLWEIDPDHAAIPDDDASWYFKQDMLQLKHSMSNRLLDVGWYPEGDIVRGRYVIEVYDGDFHGNKLHRYETRDRLALVHEIERLLAAVAEGDL
jgi:hypothetical protein